jgi:outer membrane protein, heavy metal efflux system
MLLSVQSCSPPSFSSRLGCWRLLTLCLGIALLAGCARFKPQPISPEISAAGFDSRSLTNDNLRAFLETNHIVAEWPCRNWDLNALTFVAFYYQPSLAEARAQLASVRAVEITAGERPNPSLSVTPTYDTTTSPPWIPGVSWDIPLETAGKRGKRIAQALFASEAAKWDFVSTEWQVRSQVRTALLTLYSARQNESLLERALLAQSNVVRLLQGQLSAGAISSFEVTQARVAEETAELARQDALGQLRQGRVQLAGVLGLPSPALDGMEFNFDALQNLPRDLTAPEIRREAVLNRADVRAALAEYAASQSALQLEIAKQYPDVHLNPGYELDQTDNKWTLGLTLDLPVLNQNQGGIAEAKAKRAQAAAHFLTVQANAISQIDTALAAYDAALQKSATAKSLLEDLQKQLDSVRAQAQLGEADALALANAEVSYFTGMQNQLDALAKAQQALGQLEDAVQSPLTLSADALRVARNLETPK